MRPNKREGGAALLIAMLVLVLVSALAISSLETVMRDQQISSVQARKRLALQAAEAGVAAAQGEVSSGVTIPSINLTQLGDAAMYPLGRPTYGPDTSGEPPVTNLGAQAASGMNLRIDGNGAPKFQVQLWRIRVEGTEPGGILSRIETSVSSFKGN
jgi:type II secretory pathway pseudopilin PulG